MFLLCIAYICEHIGPNDIHVHKQYIMVANITACYTDYSQNSSGITYCESVDDYWVFFRRPDCWCFTHNFNMFAGMFFLCIYTPQKSNRWMGITFTALFLYVLGWIYEYLEHITYVLKAVYGVPIGWKGEWHCGDDYMDASVHHPIGIVLGALFIWALNVTPHITFGPVPIGNQNKNCFKKFLIRYGAMVRFCIYYIVFLLGDNILHVVAYESLHTARKYFRTDMLAFFAVKMVIILLIYLIQTFAFKRDIVWLYGKHKEPHIKYDSARIKYNLVWKWFAILCAVYMLPTLFLFLYCQVMTFIANGVVLLILIILGIVYRKNKKLKSPVV